MDDHFGPIIIINIIIKNSINKNKIKIAHYNYFNRMFDSSFNDNRKQFWKYIRANRKDHHNISSLNYLRHYKQGNNQFLPRKTSLNEWMWQPCESFAYYVKYYILITWNSTTILAIY